MAKIWDKEKFTKSKSTFKLLGCDMETFRAHIQSKFTEGMSWDNYPEWQFDHITPLLYDNPTQAEMERRMHYTNIQPMWASENAVKGNRFVG